MGDYSQGPSSDGHADFPAEPSLTRDAGRSVQFPEQVIDQLVTAPPNVQEDFIQRLAELSSNLLHPNLHAKRYDETVWQARVNQDWCFYFTIANDVYCLVEIVPHPK